MFLVAATLNFECIEQGKRNINRRGNMRWEGRCGFVSYWAGYQIEYCRGDEEWTDIEVGLQDKLVP